MDGDFSVRANGNRNDLAAEIAQGGTRVVRPVKVPDENGVIQACGRQSVVGRERRLLNRAGVPAERCVEPEIRCVPDLDTETC